MTEKLIFITILVISFLQVIHIFEEIYLKAYNFKKFKNSKKLYLFIASILILLNYLIIFLLYSGFFIGYYLAIYTILMSIGNMLAHVSFYFKSTDKKSKGFGVLTSIPLGIAGIVLLVLLIGHFFF